MRTLTAGEVVFSVTAEPEYIRIEGNCLASGDDAVDAKCAAEIRADLESGNEWAWCQVTVTAEWDEHKGHSYLGGCSYKSKKDFVAEDGYYPEMKESALADLNANLAAIEASIRKLL